MASNQKIELKKGGQNVDGVFVPSITSNDLTSKPEFKIEPAKPPTKVPGMLGALESSADSFVENLTQKREQAQAEEEASFTSYLNAKVDTPTAAGLQASTYAQKGGVNDIEQELLGINQQIRAEQLGLRRQLERIDKNKGGGLASGLMAERNSAERESLAKQADLSVIQMGVQGRYDSAKAIADRAIDAQLEQSKNELEAMSLMYERNKDLFTQAEQREFETMQGDRNRKLEQEAAEKKTISDLSLDALQNGASPTIAAQMRGAKTLDEAIKIGGQYVGLLDRQLKQMQMSKLKKEISLLGEPSEAQKEKMEQAKTNAETAVAVANDKIQTIDLLYKKNPDGSVYKHPGMKGSVGAYGIARWTPLDADKAERTEFIATVEQLTSQEFIDRIIGMKAQGGTLGALNEEEGRQMRNAATKVEQWKLKDDNGKVYGYETSEQTMGDELLLLRSLAQRAVLRAGGSLVTEEEDEELDNIINTARAQSTPQYSGASFY